MRVLRDFSEDDRASIVRGVIGLYGLRIGCNCDCNGGDDDNT